MFIVFLVVPHIYCASDLKSKERLINGKVLGLIEISTMLMFECFDFANEEITIIWHAG